MAQDEDTRPITRKTLMAWASILTAILGAAGTVIGLYMSLRLDMTLAQHDIENNKAAIAEIRRDQVTANAKINEMDKKLTEVVTILRRLDPAKTSASRLGEDQ